MFWVLWLSNVCVLVWCVTSFLGCIKFGITLLELFLWNLAYRVRKPHSLDALSLFSFPRDKFNPTRLWHYPFSKHEHCNLSGSAYLAWPSSLSIQLSFWFPCYYLIELEILHSLTLTWSWISFASLHIFMVIYRVGYQPFHCLLDVLSYCYSCLISYYFYISILFHCLLLLQPCLTFSCLYYTSPIS